MTEVCKPRVYSILASMSYVFNSKLWTVSQ